ncbi:hypothetical protein STRDD10_01152 [Streptococcus sp. DD10]|uniref:hypothetical protein n=1 Tax=Streptococcus sp. DD10 TaxID=1777878 RepID=UPI0007929218|nr:hypothetical protein [Streptococcus sp. DD10]KXT74168.1 hypothetical protein STRDD10_01152 [Streptococcus sp. DD10]
MLQRILHAIRYYPEQAFLLVFNTGVFAWLQATGTSIANQIGLTSAWNQYVPDVIKSFVGDSAPAVQAFFGHSAVTWFIGSMIILAVLRFVKGLIKFLLMAFVILVGVYLVYRYQATLQGLLG